MRQEEGDEIIDGGGAHICAFFPAPPRSLLFSRNELGACVYAAMGKWKGGKDIRTSIDDGESARGWGWSEKVGEGVVEIASLNGAPAGDAGVLVSRLDDFGLCGSLVVFVVLSLFNAWRGGVPLRRASPTSSSPS